MKPLHLETEKQASLSLEQKGGPRALPIEAKKDSLLEKIDNEPSVILIGETGSGKTTKTPQYLLERYLDKKIAVTSPRVFPARSVSKFVASSLGSQVGEEVGLITRQDRRISEETRLTFMTDGVLLNMLRNDPTLSDLGIVMVDEAHERTINIDLLLGLLKQAQQLRKKQDQEPLKIIVASATIEEKKFTEYFDEAPVEKVEGRMFPVELKYHPIDKDLITGNTKTLTQAAADLAVDVIKNTDRGDVLLFMPGEEEIKKTIEALGTSLSSDDVEILPLFGSMNPKDQDKIFGSSKKRKIIVATNIAETSVTIDGVEHVIDSGYVKEKRYNPETGIHSLELVKASQANLNQRMGRAGRTSPGTCYRLMPISDFESREPFQKAEILRSDLAEVVLRMKEMGINDVEHFDFIEKPDRARLHAAILQLQELGALDKKGIITDIGREMSSLELRPDLSRMLVEAKYHDVVREMVNLCAMLSASKAILINENKNEKDFNKRMENAEKIERQNTLRVPGSDILTLLNVWNAWVDSGYSRAFATDYLLNTRALDEVGLVRMQLLRALGQAGISNTQEGAAVDTNTLIKCIVAGVPQALFFSNDERRYYNPVHENPSVVGTQIFPGSSAFKRGKMVILAMNINRSEKMVTDRFSGREEKKSALYARICHNLTLNDIRQIYGEEAVKEVAQGEPYYSSYGNGEGTQTYKINVLGKDIGFEKRTVSILERAVSGCIGYMHQENEEVVHTYNDLIKRSGKALRPIVLTEAYKQLIEELSITTEEEIEDNAGRFRISLDDLMTKEEQESIERDSPSSIDVGGKRYIVTYQKSFYGNSYDTAEININNEEDFSSIEFAEIPSFPRMKDLHFSYQMRQFRSREEIRNFIEREKQWAADAPKRQEELYRSTIVSNDRLEGQMAGLAGLMGSSPKRASDERSVEDGGVSRNKPLRPVQPKPEKEAFNPEAKVAEWKESFENVRLLLQEVGSLVKDQNEKIFKDKNKVLDRIKELRTESNGLIRAIEQEGYNESLTGKVSTFMRDFEAALKRSKIENLTDSIVRVRTLSKSLGAAATRNGVELDEAMQSKIRSAAVSLIFSGKGEVTDDEADELLINLV